MSSTNASSSTPSCSSNGVTMAVMTDPMPCTGAIIPHVVEVEARDDVRVVVQDGPWPLDRALRAGGAAHLADLRRRVPRMHDGPVLAMTAVHGGIVRARRAGYFDMVATADALAGDPALHARAGALAGDDPLHRGDGRAAAIGLSVAALVPGGRVLLGRRRADLPLDPGRWHVVPSGMLEPEPDPIAAALAREAREELGVDVDPRRGAHARARVGPRAPAARGVRGAGARCGPGAGRRRRVRGGRGVRVARPAPLPGAACALALLGSARARGLAMRIDVNAASWPSGPLPRR